MLQNENKIQMIVTKTGRKSLFPILLGSKVRFFRTNRKLPTLLNLSFFYRVCAEILALILLTACEQPAPRMQQQFPSPMIDNARLHERIQKQNLPGNRLEIRSILTKPVQVYIPEKSRGQKPVVPLIHFHGAPFVAEHAAYQANRPFVAISINLGSGSSAYERPFQDPQVLPKILSALGDSLNSSRFIPVEVLINKITLSAFSAGYGAVRAILRQPENTASISSVLLLDGLHTDYVPVRTTLAQGGELNAEKLAPFLDFARLALAKKKEFVISHSAVFPGTYASTTETSDYLLEQFGLQRRAVLKWGVLGMQQVSEAGEGNFSVLGFAGNSAPDHIDHFHALFDFLGKLHQSN